MKRGLVFTLCAVALAAGGRVAHAQGALDVALSLNLRYTDPADPSEGGTWTLVAKTGSADGLAAVNAYLSNVTNPDGVVYGNGLLSTGYPGTITAATINAFLDGTNTPFAGTFGSVVNVVYGQNTSIPTGGPAGPVVLDIGNGGAAGLVASDPLKNATWNNSAVILQGTFGGTRPAFGTGPTNNTTDANVLGVGQTNVATNLAALDAATTTVVRGDSVATDGIERGDANRDWTVNADDFNILALNFGQPGDKTWGQGDFNDTGTVNADDFNFLALNFGPPNPTPPAVGAASSVPEPGSLAMFAVAASGLLAARRRRLV